MTDAYRDGWNRLSELVTGTCFANVGNQAICLDIDQVKMDILNDGICPIYKPCLDEMIRRNTKTGRLHFTTSVADAYRSAEVIFICVGTLSDEQGRADLKYVLTAAAEICKAIAADSAGRDARGGRCAGICTDWPAFK